MKIKFWKRDGEGRFSNFRRWLTPGKTMRKTAFRMGVMFGVYGLVVFGGFLGERNIVVNTLEAQAVEVKKEIPPIMAKIAKCESPTGHLKDGQVVINQTLDIGKYQINKVHFKAAAKMGLDLSKEEDNEAFALYLFHTQGTEPWFSSKKCWAK